VVFFSVDFTYLAANTLKIPAGGWFPLLIGAIAFTFLTTWAKGRQLMISRMNEASLPMEIFIKSAAPSAARVPGTAVFMTSSASSRVSGSPIPARKRRGRSTSRSSIGRF